MAKRRGIVDFARDAAMEKSRSRCKVCQLFKEDPTIAAEWTASRGREIPTRTFIDWLKTDCSVDLLPGDFTTHINGRHQ